MWRINLIKRKLILKCEKFYYYYNFMALETMSDVEKLPSQFRDMKHFDRHHRIEYGIKLFV